MLGFPCNQFGDQENCENHEIMSSLEHVRPGSGFQPRATMFEKARGANVVKYKELVLQVEVNGSEENPIFTFLKSSLPSPSDSKVVVVMNLMSVHFAHEHKKNISV